MTDKSTVDAAPALRCKPTKANLIITLGLAMFGGCTAALPVSSEQPMPLWGEWLCWAVGGVLIVIGGAVAVWVARAEVVLDDEGVTWRGLFGRRQIRWDAVTDYYLRPRRCGNIHALHPVIEAGGGHLELLEEWAHVDAFREWIQRKATHARVSEWGIIGARPVDDGALHFHYRSMDGYTAHFLGAMGALWVVLEGTPGAGRSPGILAAERLEHPTLYMAGLLCAACVVGALVYCGFRSLIGASRRLDERITADADGITFEHGQRRVRALWDDVVHCDRVRGRIPTLYIVVTRQGSFDFTTEITGSRLLRETIVSRASHADVAAWHARAQDEVLGGERLRWPGGKPGVGERVFHYRTRTHRALLLLATSIASIAPVSAAADRLFGLPFKGDAVFLLVLTSAFAFAVAWGWWRYFAASIRIDDAGIVQLAPFSRRVIPWPEVRACRRTRWADFRMHEVEGERMRIHFFDEIADLPELEAEIAKRSPEGADRGW